jgi:DNA-binding XRE family transcriptional regulator
MVDDRIEPAQSPSRLFEEVVHIDTALNRHQNMESSAESDHSDPNMLTSVECQAARGRLQWTRETLAREAGVDVGAVIAFELERSPPSPALIAALTGALEAAQMVPTSILPAGLSSTI